MTQLRLSVEEAQFISGFRSLSKEQQDAFVVILDALLAEQQPERNPRLLIERLRAVHACPKADEPTFLQLSSTGGNRAWCCQCCGGIVDLIGRS